MSLYCTDTRYNSANPIYAPLPISVSSLSVSSLTANRITANSTISGFIEGTYGEYSNWYVDTKLFVNFQELTADADQLFLNGVPLATTSDLSNIEDWSIYAQISTLDGNGQDIRATNFLEASRISVSTLGASNATLTTIVGSNATFTNLFTQNLMAFNIVNFTSTVIEVYESTIQSDIKLANISSLNVGNGVISNLSCGNISTNTLSANNLNTSNISTVSLYAGTGVFGNFTASSITVSSIVQPGVPNGVFSSITVAGNTTTNSFNEGGGGATFATTATFNNGANFNGTRANLNSGFATSGTAFFNNQTICNLATVSNSNTALNLIVDASTNTSTYPTINLQSKFGGGGIVNITADSPSIFVLVPTQQVNIRAKGGVGYVTGIPVGGAINLTADAGTSNAITPTGVLANGAIRLTANSFINGAFTVPGLILQSAGSISAYSGLTSPVAGVYGCSFYSALTTLSLTCGVTPATTSFPGVVYLRGDNGTKVVNGFYADTINNNVGYDLDIRSKTIDISNRNINIDSASNVNINSSNGGQVYINGSVVGPNTFVSTATSALNMATYPVYTSSIIGLSSINGVAYTGGGGGWVGTASSDLNMNGYQIKAPSLLFISTPFLYLNAPTVCAVSTNQFYVVANQILDIGCLCNITISNNGGYGSANIQLQSANNTNIYASNSVQLNAFSNSITLDAYSDIIMKAKQNAGFIGSNGVILSAGDPSTSYTAMAFTSTNVDILSVGAGGYIRRNAQNNILDTAGGNIQTQAVSTINSVPETVFTGDVLVSSFKQTLIGTAVPQPVIQYGVVSSSGSSGSVVVSMPTRYTTQQSYVPFACMADDPPAQVYVSTNNRGAFTIGWSSGGSGVHYFNWQTMGT